MCIAEDVYYTLLGQLCPPYCVPGVENIFVPGGKYYENYALVMEAYKRLLIRLNEAEGNDDIEIIINSLLDNEKIAAQKMFEYGQKQPHP